VESVRCSDYKMEFRRRRQQLLGQVNTTGYGHLSRL
jgi:hypothetical protein